MTDFFFKELLLLWTASINKKKRTFPTDAFFPNVLLLGTREYWGGGGGYRANISSNKYLLLMVPV